MRGAPGAYSSVGQSVQTEFLGGIAMEENSCEGREGVFQCLRWSVSWERHSPIVVVVVERGVGEVVLDV